MDSRSSLLEIGWVLLWPWPIEYGTRDAMRLLRLGQKMSCPSFFWRHAQNQDTMLWEIQATCIKAHKKTWGHLTQDLVELPAESVSVCPSYEWTILKWIFQSPVDLLQLTLHEAEISHPYKSFINYRFMKNMISAIFKHKFWRTCYAAIDKQKNYWIHRWPLQTICISIFLGSALRHEN